MIYYIEEIDRAQIGIQLKSGNKVGGLLFADDFVGITESSENLQQLIDIIYDFCSKWRLRVNVNKSVVLVLSVVLVFGKDKVKGKWNWGDRVLPIVSNYTYPGVDFSYNGAWDAHNGLRLPFEYYINNNPNNYFYCNNNINYN